MSLFIFRHDLRIVDNIGFNKFLLEDKCICVFVLDKEQLFNKVYSSKRAIQFMIEALVDLNKALKTLGLELNIIYGVENLHKLIFDYNITRVFTNYDYTPYALIRDTKLYKFLKQNSIELICFHDYYINIPGEILNKSGTLYKKFTPYYNSVKELKVKRCKTVTVEHKKIKINDTVDIKDLFYVCEIKFEQNTIYGSRERGLYFLKKYKAFISPYIRFGLLSIREVYYYFKSINDEEKIRQLYWRDFYINLINEPPKKSIVDKMKWNNTYFSEWKDGRTGFPVIDAGMRELNQTGFMSNRWRMVTACFLVKILHVDWTLGEKYFAQKLIDYDISINKGNWRWIVGNGIDSRPYYRVFNPWIQSNKFDKHCEYIKKYVPELNKITPKHIHNWYYYYSSYKIYLKPIVEYKKQKELYLSYLNS